MKRRSAFTLIELLVVIAIIALLVSILMPSLQKAKEMAKDVVCRSHQKNVSLAIFLYAQEHGDSFPYTANRITVGGDPFAPNLHWAVRVGRIDEYEMPDYFDANTAHERIALEGYIDYHWWIRDEGSFKCPSARDQVEPKPMYPLFPDGTKSAGWGNCFSINGTLSKEFDEAMIGSVLGFESDDFPTCMRLDDVRTPCVLIGDGTLGPGGGIYVSARYRAAANGDLFYFPRDEETAQTGFGPWPFLEVVNPWTWSSMPCDFPGHAGEAANLTYTDGHVESVKYIDKKWWNPH